MIRVEEVVIDPRKIKDAYWTLKALTMPVPKRIMEILRNYPQGRNVTHLYITLRLDQSQCSQALALLRRYNLVIATRSGKNIIYRINEERMEQISNALDKFFLRQPKDFQWAQTVVA